MKKIDKNTDKKFFLLKRRKDGKFQSRYTRDGFSCWTGDIKKAEIIPWYMRHERPDPDDWANHDLDMEVIGDYVEAIIDEDSWKPISIKKNGEKYEY